MQLSNSQLQFWDKWQCINILTFYHPNAHNCELFNTEENICFILCIHIHIPFILQTQLSSSTCITYMALDYIHGIALEISVLLSAFWVFIIVPFTTQFSTIPISLVIIQPTFYDNLVAEQHTNLFIETQTEEVDSLVNGSG